MQQIPICYIVCALPQSHALAPNPGDLVIAADGGLTYLEQHGLAPDLVVGDFDSLTEKPSSELKTVVLPKVKDDTDMVAALREGKNRGFRVFPLV